MHIPENYLSPTTCAVMGAAMIPILAVAVKKVKAEISPEKMPMLGVGAAFSFLIMMFNVPLPGGTTGHAVGAVLVAVLLGPYAACLAVTVALALQALLFGDGGVLALGANCFNMAFVMPFVGYGVYTLSKKIIKGKGAVGDYVGMALGGYIGLNVAALFTAIEFGVQPLLFAAADGTPLYCPYPLAIAIPAMMIPHLLVAGVIEAAFTALVCAFVMKTSPGMIDQGAGKRASAVYVLVAAMICLVPLGLLAAGTAWGEWGADEIAEVVTNGAPLGFVPAGLQNGFSFEAVMPDYSLAGVPETAGYILCALFGTAISIILFRLLAGLKKNRRTA